MAGVLAPTIQEAGGVFGAPTPPVDTSTGDLLSGVGRILSGAGTLAGDVASGDGLTQTERDRKALRPIMEDARRLKRKREAGSLSPAEYRARLSKLTSSGIAAFPDKADTIKDGISSIIGEEVGEPAEDPVTARNNMIASLISDPDNTEAQMAYLESFTVDKNGQFDQEATVAKFEQAWMRKQIEKAQVEEIKLRSERLSAEDAEAQAVQQQSVEGFIAEGVASSQRLVNGFVQASENAILLGEAEGRPSAGQVQSAITELKKLRAQQLNRAQVLATQGGFLDNIEGTFEDGIETVVAPIDNVLSILERLSKEDAALFEQMQARDKVFFTNVAMGAGAPVPTLIAESEPAQVLLVEALRTELGIGIDFLKRNPEVFQKDPMTARFGAGMHTKLLDEDGNPTPAMEESKNELSVDEKKRQVKAGTARLKALGQFNVKDENTVNKMVSDFVVGLETMNGLKVAEDTFDRIYDTSFFKAYNNVQSRGGIAADALNSAVSRNIVELLSQRKLEANTTINSLAGETFPSMGLVFNGESFDIELSGFGKNDFETALVNNLRAEGLEVSFQGMKEFARKKPNEATLRFNLPKIISEVEEDLRYLNKIVGVTNKFPEDVRNEMLPTGRSAESIPLITSFEEFSDLEAGQRYKLKTEDGIFTFTRGEETGGPAGNDQ